MSYLQTCARSTWWHVRTKHTDTQHTDTHARHKASIHVLQPPPRSLTLSNAEGAKRHWTGKICGIQCKGFTSKVFGVEFLQFFWNPGHCIKAEKGRWDKYGSKETLFLLKLVNQTLFPLGTAFRLVEDTGIFKAAYWPKTRTKRSILTLASDRTAIFALLFSAEFQQ